MEFAYRPEAWQHTFEMVAQAVVTLTGLLFIGLSMNLRAIVGNPALAIPIAGAGLVTRELGGLL